MITTDDIFKEFVAFVKSHDDLDAVYKEYGGSNLYIPSYKSICRDKNILEDFSSLRSEGKSTPRIVRELARKYDLSSTAIYTITKELREPSLF